MFTRGFFTRKTKKLLVLGNDFHHAFLYENCAGCAICKLHLAVLVAIRKSQLVVHKKALKLPRVKMLMKSIPGLLFVGMAGTYLFDDPLLGKLLANFCPASSHTSSQAPSQAPNQTPSFKQ